MNERKQHLIALSEKAKLMMEMGETDYSSVNEVIMNEFYPGGVYKTFGMWRKEGYKVNKGSKGYAIWGKKRQMSKKTENEDGTETEKKWNAFPVAYLFNEDQVTKNES
jgi:hypothetical protein